MKYQLFTMNLASESFINISSKEYEDTKLSVDKLLKYTSIEEKFDLFIENYMDYDRSLFQSAQIMMLQGGQEHFWFNNHRRLHNRHLSNLLAAAASYVTHARVFVSKISGTSIGNIFDDFVRKIHKDNFEYRLMVKLRDHLIHYGEPTHSSGYDQWKDKDFTKILFSAIQYINPIDIEINDKFPAHIIEELRGRSVNVSGTQLVDIRPLVRTFLELLRKINYEMREQVKSDITQATQIVRDRIRLFEAVFTDEKPLALVAAELTDDDTIKDKVNLNYQFLNYIDFLREKNSMGPAVSKYFITQESRT